VHDCTLHVAVLDGDVHLAYFFFASRRRHTRCYRDWSSDVCSSDLQKRKATPERPAGTASSEDIDEQTQHRIHFHWHRSSRAEWGAMSLIVKTPSWHVADTVFPHRTRS